MAVSGRDKGFVSVTAAETITTERVNLISVRWVSSAATAADQCVLTDTDGTVLFESFAEGANWVDIHYIDRIVEGLKTTVLESGTLYLYWE